MKTEEIIIYENLRVEKTNDDLFSTYEKDICPLCGELLTVSGRCRTCYSCGYSTCDL